MTTATQAVKQDVSALLSGTGAPSKAANNSSGQGGQTSGFSSVLASLQKPPSGTDRTSRDLKPTTLSDKDTPVAKVVLADETAKTKASDLLAAAADSAASNAVPSAAVGTSGAPGSDATAASTLDASQLTGATDATVALQSGAHWLAAYPVAAAASQATTATVSSSGGDVALGYRQTASWNVPLNTAGTDAAAPVAGNVAVPTAARATALDNASHPAASVVQAAPDASVAPGTTEFARAFSKSQMQSDGNGAAQSSNANTVLAGTAVATQSSAQVADTKLTSLQSAAVAQATAANAAAPAVPVVADGLRDKVGARDRRSTDTVAQTPVGVSSSSTSTYNQSYGSAVAATPTDTYIADQVSYWISHDVKNASLKLDGLGSKPVEVSISMQGNEAQVAFRSDDPSARDLLQHASAHLKEMLQQEGVVLSGVSVGTSGGDNAKDQQASNPASSMRQAIVAPSQSDTLATGTRSGQASGRALDIFV